MKTKILFHATLALMAITINSFSQEGDSTKINKIDEVEISAYRVNSNLGKLPEQIKIIDAQEIQSIPSRGFDELIKKSIAIDIIQYQGFSSVIGMRGFAPSGFGKANTLIMVDGIPIGSSNLSTLNLDNVKQIEILKGPYSAFFGSDAMAGVINISTNQSKDKLSGNASVEYGSFNTYKVGFNLGGKITSKLNFDLYANTRIQDDNYKTGSNNLLKLTDLEKQVMDEKSYGKEFLNSKYKQYTVGGRLGFQINENWKIRLDESYWLAKDIQNNGSFWGTYGGQLQDISRWSQSLTLEGKQGNHHFRLTPHFSNESNIYYSDLTDNAFKNTNNILQTYGLVVQDAIDLGNQNLIIGVDNLSRKFKSQIWSAAETQASPYQPDYLNMSTGAYLQFNMHFLDEKLNASIGGRYDNISFKLYKTDLIESQDASESYNVINPNFGLNYKFLNGFKAHTAAGTAFVAPDAFKVAGNYTTMFGTYKGNPELKPEKSVTYDFGLSFENKKSGFDADITYFSTVYKNIVGYDYSNLAYTSFKNENEADMSGLEMNFNYDFGALSNYRYSLKAYVDWTYMLNSKVKTGNNELDMRYVRKNKANFGLMYSAKNGLCARINARYIGQRFEDNWLYDLDWNTYERIPAVDANGNQIRPSLINQDIIEFPDHLAIDLSLSYLFKKKYGIGLTVDNLFDENYCEKDMYYMPGRSIMASFSVKF
jgi:vitamin B12 transporter